jgi:hypothetical protein
MSDPTNPQPFTPDPDVTGESDDDLAIDEDLSDLGLGGDDRPGGDRPDETGPGAPGNAEPMSDSTDGGLDGGDPGVEE